MIPNNGLTVAASLRTVALHLCPDSKNPPKSFFKNEATYLGDGYWRCFPVHNASGKIVGMRLANPDYTQMDIYVIEKGLATLLHMGFAASFNAIMEG